MCWNKKADPAPAGKKRIAVLTSGGDAPGMNAAVRAVVRAGIFSGFEVVGIRNGYNGLLEDLDEKQFDGLVLREKNVSKIIDRGGTMLYTARCPEFVEPKGVQKGADFCRKHNICGVVVIGGDGSFRGARDLSDAGIPCIGIPATIDNDIMSSYYSIGYDTALNTAMRMIDNLRDSAESLDRCSVVEVMGAHAGYLAIYTGIACGAISILVPERHGEGREVDKQVVFDRIKQSKQRGARHFIVVVAEGVGLMEGETPARHKQHFVDILAEEIERVTGIVSRASILGHVQRGGSPTMRDRIMATELGCYAVKLLAEDKRNRVVAVNNNGQITDLDINDALNPNKDVEHKKIFPIDLLDLANTVSM